MLQYIYGVIFEKVLNSNKSRGRGRNCCTRDGSRNPAGAALQSVGGSNKPGVEAGCVGVKLIAAARS